MRRTGVDAFRTIWAALLLAGPAPALAATVVCGGTVARLAYHANGNVMLQLTGMNTPIFICSFDSNWDIAPGFVTTPATCKAMYASFLAAKLSGTSVNNVWFDGPGVPASCSTWADWSYANVRYYEQ